MEPQAITDWRSYIHRRTEKYINGEIASIEYIIEVANAVYNFDQVYKEPERFRAG